MSAQTYTDVNPRYGSSRYAELVFDVQAINSSIENIFGISRGEYWWFPTFGSNLLQYVHEPLDESTAQDIYFEILDALENWEPRIKVTMVQVIPNLNSDSFDITVKYIINANSIQGSYTAQLRRN